MPIYTELNGFTDISQSSVTELMESNIVMFLDWGFINKGAFFNVTVPSSGQYSARKDVLRLVSDTRYQLGQVWEAFRSNWVWQSGLSTSKQPIQVSGVYVNNTFYPLSTTGAFAHTVDYNNGRVVFNSPIPTGSIVSCNYTYRWISVGNADKFPWFKEIQYTSFRNDSSQFTQVASGDWFGLAQTRLQMPTLVVEMAQGGRSEPYALGGGKWVYRRGVINIFTEEEQSCKRIADVIHNQDQRSIFEINLDAIATNHQFPLTDKGMIASGALTYPQMIASYQWNQMRFVDMEIQNMKRITPRLWHIPVSVTIQGVLPNI